MSEILRPEARAALIRWREVIAGVLLAGLGLWWGLTAFGVLRWLGWALLATGGAVALAGAQRALFRQGGGGPGVVQIDERRIAYFGPVTGGVIDLDDLTRLELDPDGPQWLLSGVGGQSLAIPVDAEGADALFDAFAALPGIRPARMLDALRQPGAGRVVVWALPVDVTRRLH